METSVSKRASQMPGRWDAYKGEGREMGPSTVLHRRVYIGVRAGERGEESR